MDEKFDVWAILELMGHVKLAGHITEVELGGGKLMRIDIPPVPPCEGFTKFFGVGAIYSMTPVSEEVARGVAATVLAEPIKAWDLPDEWTEKLRGLPAPPAPDMDEWDDEGK